jgi:hypothetical protein
MEAKGTRSFFAIHGRKSSFYASAECEKRIDERGKLSADYENSND